MESAKPVSSTLLTNCKLSKNQCPKSKTEKADVMLHGTGCQVQHILGKDNVVENMLSRAWFGDDIVELDNEEVLEDNITSNYACRVHVIREFWEEEYEGQNLLIGKMLQEIGESSNNKEKRVEIRKKKGQV